ncbi:MAG: hypothetical protein ACHREM_11765 [Polyangiales bacterium]
MRELLVAVVEIARLVSRPYAITGALAMSAYGYTRPTEDVDVFLVRRHLLKWLRAAREVGLSTTPVVEGRHYMAWFRRHADSNICIDMMFPSPEVYVDGVRSAQLRRVGGVSARVLSLEFIAAAKLASRDEKHSTDFDAMLSRDLFDRDAVADVVRTLRHADDQALADGKLNEPHIGWFDPVERAKEKAAQRVEQMRRCEESEEVRAQVQREVGFLSAIAREPLDFSKLRR